MVPSETQLLDRARAMVPMLAAQAQACEDNRSLLPQTVAAFEAAGFYRILQPALFGGYEMHPMALFRVAMELARGCPSSAWCLCLVAVHNWEMGLLDPRAGQDVWGQNTAVRISSSFAPFGKVEAVEGGYNVSGRWPWSSGCDQCDWAMLGGVTRLPDGRPEPRAFLIPRSHYVIDDTWQVFGLKGTGSKDIVVEQAFVPEHRTHSILNSFLRQDVGAATFTAPTYQYPFGLVFAYTLAVVTLGMAQGARDTFAEQMATQLGTFDRAKAAEDPFVRQRLAEADALIRGQKIKLEAIFAEIDSFVAAGRPIPMEVRVNAKWDSQVMGKASMQAIELLFKATGGRGIRSSNPMQRFFRDVHAASNHAFLNADKGSLNAGGVMLGADGADLSL